MAHDKDADEVVDALKAVISKDPNFRLATDKEVKALLEPGKEERAKQREEMEKPEYNAKIAELKESWYARARTMTPKELPEFFDALAGYKHDYNTVVYAVAAVAIAAAWAMDKTPNGGITGFQAGAVFWEFYGQWLGEKGKPARIVKFQDMLYPQYEESFEKTITPETWKWLHGEAQKKLQEQDGASKAVLDHWRSIAEGVVPFGYSVKER
jgi:hypothetical protein